MIYLARGTPQTLHRQMMLKSHSMPLVVLQYFVSGNLARPGEEAGPVFELFRLGPDHQVCAGQNLLGRLGAPGQTENEQEQGTLCLGEQRNECRRILRSSHDAVDRGGLLVDRPELRTDQPNFSPVDSKIDRSLPLSIYHPP